MTIKTLTIVKRGRKYFECRINGYSCKLVINETSTALEPGQEIRVSVNDLSTSTKYGTTLMFEPLSIVSDKDMASMREKDTHRKRAGTWLCYAENDARDGRYSSNAIHMAQKYLADYPEFAERLARLNVKVEKNRKAYEDQQKAKEAARRQRVVFPLSELPPLHVPVRLGKSVVVYESRGKSFEIDEDMPSLYGSRLLGYEGDWGCYCYYRAATSEEIANLAAEEAEIAAAAAAKKNHQNAVNEIAEQITTAGERPIGMSEVHGQRLLDSQDIYGGGRWFVVADDAIWYIVNHGADGDQWAANNVRTGGGGAIGYRIPYDAAIATRLLTLNEAEEKWRKT